jgi:hypothetical protein
VSACNKFSKPIPGNGCWTNALTAGASFANAVHCVRR